MKSKKLIFLTLVALSFMSTAVNAWRDYDDNDDYENVVYEDEYRRPGIVRSTGRVAEGAVEGTGRVAEGAVEGAGEIVRAPFKMFGGD